MLDPGDPEVYVEFLEGALNVALFPHAARPMHVAGYNCGNAQRAWMWINRQVRGNLVDPEWANLALPDSIISAYTAALRRIARCQRPL